MKQKNSFLAPVLTLALAGQTFFFSPGCSGSESTDKPAAVATGVTDSAAAISALPAWALGGWKKEDDVNPVLRPGTGIFRDPVSGKNVSWEAKNVFNPAIVVRRDTLWMLYRAQDSVAGPTGTSRIGLAWSVDGLRFTRRPTPVFYPAADAEKKLEWPGGCEDPRVVEDSAGVCYMTYTAYDGTTARLMIATSPDMIHWTKHGAVFAAAMNGKYKNAWSKSGSIVSRYSGGRIVATRIGGKYWMYWGDLFIWAATSDDLIHWTPVEMKAGEKPPLALHGVAEKVPQLKVVIPTRKGRFDSDLVESGPPALLTDSGILLLYNSRSLLIGGDSALPDGTYTTGQVWLDAKDPTRIVHRLDHYFLRPEKPYELTGEVNNVCFIEGLARFHDRWFLYYGTADSRIAVATAP